MSKLLILLYGVVSYLIFFLTFLYLIAFLGNFGNLPFVSITIDSGEPAPLGHALLVNTALIALWASTHIIMARPWFKEHLTGIVPKAAERSTFVLVASLCLILLYREWVAMPEMVWQTTNATWVVVLWAVYLGGYGLVLVSTFLINHFELFGLSQVFANMKGNSLPPYKFVQPLFYKIIRHPLYLGWLLVFWGTPEMSAGHLLLAFGMTAQIFISIPYEERDIEDSLGEPYRDYKAKTPMLVPFAKIKD